MLVLIILICKSCNDGPVRGENELIGEFLSPNENLKIYIYEGPPKDSVMVDFYVVGEVEYMKTPLHEKALIFYRYHEKFEECYWIDDEHVVINGTEIDIADKNTWVYDEQGDY